MAEGGWILGEEMAEDELQVPHPMAMHSSAAETEHVSALL
jgi:hypothetical protein